ncbi:MAG: SEL1-like repeat protein [Candidatus Methanomethylophilaceae archaeon]|nr:SEL1-like repeat protein [Candidatus Methanomethylophilaceae archaeon]
MRDPIFRAAEMGDPYACLGVAYYYHEGKEVEPDMGLAVEWYRRAASRGCPRAHWELAKLYSEGILDNTDVSAYVRHLRSASEMGNVDAQYALAKELYSGDILGRNVSEASEWFRRAAEKGHVKAKFMVGYLIQNGQSGGSSADAEMWFLSAGMSGDGDTFLEIGLDYEYGLDDISQDHMEAVRWYKYGADMGHEKCILCYRRALEILSGANPDSYKERLAGLDRTAVQRETDVRDAAVRRGDESLAMGDEKAAYENYSEAADLGDPDAMFAIAMMYHQGMYLKRNDRKAMEILTRAASAGSCDAQFMLGRFYDNSEYPRDETLAIQYYAQAAANGFLAAFYYLGNYMEHPETYVRRVRGRRCRSNPS